VLIDRRILPGEADHAAQPAGVGDDVEAGDPGAARVGLEQRREHPHGGGLAGPVGPQQAHHRALRHRKI
jgi:hypothetical protein